MAPPHAVPAHTRHITHVLLEQARREAERVQHRIHVVAGRWVRSLRVVFGVTVDQVLHKDNNDIRSRSNNNNNNNNNNNDNASPLSTPSRLPSTDDGRRLST